MGEVDSPPVSACDSAPVWQLQQSVSSPRHWHPSLLNGPGFGFEEGHGHAGHRGAGAATGPAVGHEWQFGNSSQHDGLER